jgi:alkylhydroperoxidase family enzyme
MNTFKMHDVASAPEASKKSLQDALDGFGMIPGFYAVMAEAPGLLEGYQKLHDLFAASSFDAEEMTVVWQTINVEHNCTYCVPAHTGIAMMMEVDPALTEALRNQAPMPTAKLQVLHDTTLAMVRQRGELSDAAIESFYAAGYSQRQLLEIVLGLSQKVMSNYVNHIAKTPVDRRFKKFAWQKK